MLHTYLVIRPNKHLTVSVCGSVMNGTSKRPWLLQPSEISELIVDTDSDEARVSRDINLVEGDYESMPGVSQPQPYCQTAYCHKSSSSISSSASDEEDADESGPDEQTQQPATLQCPHTSEAHTYTGGPRGKKDNEMSNINDRSNPLSIFLLYFAGIITLLVAQTNHYYHDYKERLDNGPSSDISEAEMFMSLALAIQMGHGIRDKLTDY